MTLPRKLMIGVAALCAVLTTAMWIAGARFAYVTESGPGTWHPALAYIAEAVILWMLLTDRSVWVGLAWAAVLLLLLDRITASGVVETPVADGRFAWAHVACFGALALLGTVYWRDAGHYGPAASEL